MQGPAVQDWAVEQDTRERRPRGGRPVGLLLIVAGAAVLALAGALSAVRLLRGARAGPAASRDRRSRRFLRVARRGFEVLRRRTTWPEGALPTPLELAEEAQRGGAGDPVDAVQMAHRYYAVRFGGRRAEPADLERAAQFLRGARRWRAQAPGTDVEARRG